MNNPQWTTQPQVSGWYLLSAEVPPVPRGATVLRVSGDDIEDEVEFRGSLYGPLADQSHALELSRS